MTINISFPANWKPLLIGLAGVVMAVYTSLMEPDIQHAIKDPSFWNAIALALLGFVAKQHNVTGGTVGQPSSTAALIASNSQPAQENPPKK